MINTEAGNRLGKIYIPYHYGERVLGVITTHLALVPKSIEQHKYNWEIIGSCELFDALEDMESVPTYDLKYYWGENKKYITYVKLTRTGRRK